MDIEFDTDKDRANIAKHRVQLADAAELLAGFYTVRPDRRYNYGEERLVATGLIGGRVHVCVYTMRGATYRLISLRKANRREADGYRKN